MIIVQNMVILYPHVKMSDYEDMIWYRECESKTLHLNHPQRCTPINDCGLYSWQVQTLEWMDIMEKTQTQHVEFQDDRTQVPKVISPNEVVKTFVKTLTAYTSVTSDSPGGLIASSVGTGKTAIVVTYALRKATHERPMLIVVPSHVEQQWVAEFERVSGNNGVSLIVNKNQTKKRKRDQSFVIWRCNTLPGIKKPPPNWRVLLITDTVVVKCVLAIRNKSVTFDFKKWIEVSPNYVKENGLGTVFHDKRWQSIVYDEITEMVGPNKFKWMQEFFNTIPAEHVWGLSSTPVHFKEIAGMLRMRRIAPIMQVLNQNFKTPVNATMRHILYDRNIDELWRQSLLCRSIRFSSKVMSHVRVHSRVVKLQLGPNEQEVLQYMKMMDMPPGNQILFCTDLSEFMKRLLKHIPRHLLENHHPVVCNEAVVVTREMFWSTMESKTNKELTLTQKTLQDVTKRVDELQMLFDAFDPSEEAREQISYELKGKKVQCRRLLAIISGYNKQKSYIDSIKNRVQEAENSSCIICFDEIPKNNVTVTPCMHVFCKDCIIPWIREYKNCPTCRANVSLSETNILVSEMPNKENPTAQYSIKISYLLTQLRVLHTTTNEKAIVFCDFPGTVSKIQSVLDVEGIVSTDLSGNIFSKNKKLRDFQSVEKCRVIFLHTDDQCSGMDLYNANHIFFVNSVHSYDVVQQAIGRCVRLSQTKPVNVTFLTVPALEKAPELAYIMGPFYQGDVF